MAHEHDHDCECGHDHDHEDELVILTDEDGNDVEFEYLDVIEYKQRQFVILLPVEATEEEPGDVVILEIGEDESGEELFLPVSSEEELNAVFDIFKEKMKDSFQFVDEE